MPAAALSNLASCHNNNNNNSSSRFPIRHFLPQSVVLSSFVERVPDIVLFDGKTPAQRMATDIFFDDFLDHINDALKAYAALTVTNRRIILQPGVNAKIIAMNQWVPDKVNMSCFPIFTHFHPPHVAALTAWHQTFLRYWSNTKMNA